MKRVLALAALLLFVCGYGTAHASGDTVFRGILIHQSDLPVGYGHALYQYLSSDHSAYILFSAGSLPAEQRAVVGYTLSFSIARFRSDALAVQTLRATVNPIFGPGGFVWQPSVGDPGEVIGSISPDPTLPDPAASKEIIGTRYMVAFVRGPFLLTESVLGRTGTMNPTTIAGYASLMDSRVMAYMASVGLH